MSKTRPRVVLVGAGGYGRLYVEALTSQDLSLIHISEPTRRS